MLEPTFASSKTQQHIVDILFLYINRYFYNFTYTANCKQTEKKINTNIGMEIENRIDE